MQKGKRRRREHERRRLILSMHTIYGESDRRAEEERESAKGEGG